MFHMVGSQFRDKKIEFKTKAQQLEYFKRPGGLFGAFRQLFQSKVSSIKTIKQTLMKPRKTPTYAFKSQTNAMVKLFGSRWRDANNVRALMKNIRESQPVFDAWLKAEQKRTSYKEWLKEYVAAYKEDEDDDEPLPLPRKRPKPDTRFADSKVGPIDILKPGELEGFARKQYEELYGTKIVFHLVSELKHGTTKYRKLQSYKHVRFLRRKHYEICVDYLANSGFMDNLRMIKLPNLDTLYDAWFVDGRRQKGKFLNFDDTKMLRKELGVGEDFIKRFKGLIESFGLLQNNSPHYAYGGENNYDAGKYGNSLSIQSVSVHWPRW